MATTKAPDAKTRRELRDIAKDVITRNLNQLSLEGWSDVRANNMTQSEVRIVDAEVHAIIKSVKKMLGRA